MVTNYLKNLEELLFMINYLKTEGNSRLKKSHHFYV